MKKLMLGLMMAFAATAAMAEGNVAEVISAGGSVTGYETLQAALDAVGVPGAAFTNTVRLICNVTENVSLAYNKAAILDLNGFTLMGKDGTESVITINGTKQMRGALTLTDTSAKQTGAVTMPEGAQGSTWGGGVYNNNGTFTLLGGTITGCSATQNGGGVFNSDGTFTMTGGTITGCTSKMNGGGVFNNNGTFALSGGTIAGCTANYGGGVYNNHGTFALSGGTISGCSATNGGGVFSNDGTFTMTGGTISGCKATQNGGGVYNAGAQATFTLSGGTIAGCTAQNCGGVYNTSTFTMTGGAVANKILGYSGTSISGGLFGKEVVGDRNFSSWLASGAKTADNPDEATKEAYPTVVRGDANCVVMVRMEGLQSVVVSNGTEAVASYPAADYRIFEVGKDAKLSLAYVPAAGRELKEDAPTTLTVDKDMVVYPVKPFVAEVISADGTQTNAYMTIEAAWSDLGKQQSSGKGVTNTVRLLRDVQGNLTVATGNATTLDLNGRTLTGADKAKSVITIKSNAALTLTDTGASAGTVTMPADATGPDNGGGVNNCGTFTLSGGTITGCKATQSGGGVYNSGTFVMTGGAVKDAIHKSGSSSISISGGLFGKAAAGVFGFSSWLASGAKTADNPDEATKEAYPTVVRGDANCVVMVRMEGLQSVVVSNGTEAVAGYPAADYRIFEVASNATVSLAYVLAAGREMKEDAPTTLTVDEDMVVYPVKPFVAEVISADGSQTNAYTTLEEAWGKLGTANAGVTNTVRLLSHVQGNLTVAAGNATTLDLNGWTLTGADKVKSVITIKSGSVLTLTDTSAKQTGTVTMPEGAQGSALGGGVCNSGTFTMFGGTITGCSAQSGGGVYNDGTFTMSGGTITGCTAKMNGGGVYNTGTQATITLSGGTISGCMAKDGGGVYNGSGTFSMSGGAVANKIFDYSGPSISGGLFGKEATGDRNFSMRIASGAKMADNPDEATTNEYPKVVRGEANCVLMVRMEGLQSVVVFNGTEAVAGYSAADYRIFEVGKDAELSLAYVPAEGRELKEEAPTSLTVDEDMVVYPVKSLGPTCDGGTIEKGDGGWVVTPNEKAGMVIIEGLPEGETVAGVRLGNFVVPSAAFDGFAEDGKTFSISLDETGEVTIGTETIPVQPTIGKLDDGEPFAVGEGSAAVTVKAIPGLKYELWRWETLVARPESAPYQVVGEPVVAKDATVTLKDGNPPDGAAFYKVVVSVP